MNANWLSNGMGGQSQYLLCLAAKRIIPATVSVTGDTGGENDRVCSTGERMTARQFFDKYVQPYAEKHGIEAIFIRSQLESGEPTPTIEDVLERSVRIAKETNADFDKMISGLWIPLFTNDKSKGRLRQVCTDKKKIRAIHQEAKRRGIKTLRSAIGFHYGESHRIKARFLNQDGQWGIWKPQTKKRSSPKGVKPVQYVMKDIRWLEHYYPLVDLKLNRADIRIALMKEGLPYLVTTECDRCPHQDYARWMMHTDEEIEKSAKIESAWKGKLFFTSLRIPLKDALQQMKEKEANKAANQQPDIPTFGCEDGAYCGI